MRKEKKQSFKFIFLFVGMLHLNLTCCCIKGGSVKNGMTDRMFSTQKNLQNHFLFLQKYIFRLSMLICYENESMSEWVFYFLMNIVMEPWDALCLSSESKLPNCKKKLALKYNNNIFCHYWEDSPDIGNPV